MFTGRWWRGWWRWREFDGDPAALKTTDEKRLWSRVIALGEFDACTRCGGCGNYSYCQMYGTTCFKCAGSGKARPKLTAALCDRIEARVAAGELDAYLEKCRLAAEGKKLGDRLFAAWAAQPEVAADKAAGKGWMHQSRLCAAINTVCSGIYDATKEDAFDLSNPTGRIWDASIKGYRLMTLDERISRAARLSKAIELVSRSQAVVEAEGGSDPEAAAKAVLARFLVELG